MARFLARETREETRRKGGVPSAANCRGRGASFTLSRTVLIRRWWPLWLLALLIPAVTEAQNSIRWTTNYYAVTGATLPQLRESIRQNRPWKEIIDVDGMTDWRVTWQFSVTPTEGGCRCNAYSTQTAIVIVLPRWTAPTNAPEAVRTIWQNYALALGQHEAGHGAIALAAAAEMHRRVKEAGEGPDCASLKQRLNTLSQQVTDDYRRRDRDYDERTRHGATQGAFLPGRMPRGR